MVTFLIATLIKPFFIKMTQIPYSFNVLETFNTIISVIISIKRTQILQCCFRNSIASLLSVITGLKKLFFISY